MIEQPLATPVESVITACEQFLDRHFWLLPFVSFGFGWASFILVQRGERLAQGIAVLALMGWVWIVAEPFVMKRMLAKEHPKISGNMSNFISQSIQQEIFFFVLPFLFAATHSDDIGQLVFTSLFVFAALISTVDPWYDRYISKHRIVSLAFHALCCFVSALVILPIVLKLPTEKSLMYALGFLVIWLLLAIPNLLPRLHTAKNRAIVVVGLCAIPICIWVFRASIPAAGLDINNAVISTGVTDHEPDDSLRQVSVAALVEGIYAYVAVQAPWGLSQEIAFKWQHGDYTETIAAEITGGREEGYRTYSMKNNFPEPSAGLWTVDVLTAQGQLLHRLDFEVIAL